MDAGSLGGLIGAAAGLAGGGIGTYVSYRNSGGPAERRFVVRGGVVLFIGIVAFLVLLLSIPPAGRLIAWVPYCVLLPLAITGINRRLQAIRSHESPQAPTTSTSSE